MKAIGVTAAALVALVTVIALVAAPAMSQRRLPAHPVEFAAPAPAPQPWSPRAGGRLVRRAATALLPVSGVVRPGKRFNLVGMRWRGGRVKGLRMRVRPAGGSWSEWVAPGTDRDHGPDRARRRPGGTRRGSDPVWAGEADEVEVSAWAGPRARDLRLQFVNTTGTATAFDRFRKTLRSAAIGALDALRSLVGARATAQSAPPAIVSRDGWGADACPPRADPSYGEVKFAFIHHTVSANGYGPEDSPAMVLAMCRYHRNSNGWNDLGYNFLVDRYGTIFEGRAGGIGEAVVGAQAQGYNSQSTGIASIGTFSSAGQTEAGLRAIARLLGWKLGVHGVPSEGQVTVVSSGGSVNRYPAGARVTFNRIAGHRDANATACPGDGLYAQLPRLREMVGPGPPRATTATVARARDRTIVYGQRAALDLQLAAGGAPLGGRSLDVQMLGRLGWRTQYTVGTNPAGRAATRVRVRSNRSLRARYVGEPGLLPSSSPAVAVNVRARVRLRLEADSAPPGAAVRLSGTVRPRKREAVLTVRRETPAGRLVRVSRRTVRLRAGRLRTSLRLRRPGPYRVRLSARRDSRNLAARADASLRIR